MIKRIYEDNFFNYLKIGKVLVFYGPRQVGKTTLLKTVLKNSPFKYRLDTGEDIGVQEVFTSKSVKRIEEYAQGYELIVIDEAQRIPNVGEGLKMLVDHVENLRVIATGSASFDLSNKIGEPLTGRKITKILYPISQLELSEEKNHFDLKNELESFLIFGSYPEVLTLKSRKDKEEHLAELVNSYLLKDILELERVRSSKTLFNLLKLLCFQVGKDVSLSELGTNLGIDYKTVARYLDLLEKSFIIKSLSGFSRNLRKEVSKSKRYFFLDNGIRNGIISNFNTIDKRDDLGMLWENFLFSERLKRNQYLRINANYYYWRTYDQKEIDLIEEVNGELSAFEFKFKKQSTKAPKDWVATYKNAPFRVATSENYLDFIAKIK